MWFLFIFCFANRVFRHNKRSFNPSNKKFDYVSVPSDDLTKPCGVDFEIDDTVDKILWRNGVFIKQSYHGSYAGTCPFEETREETDDNLFNIRKNFELLSLLRRLKSSDVSICEKMTLIDRKCSPELNYVPTLLSGGLYKDWNIEI